MPFFDATLNEVFQQQRTNSRLFLSNPRSTTAPGGGARLTRVSSNSPKEALGIVIIGPNTPRAFHPGFDPTFEADRYENDFMDRMVFVSQADYEAAEVNRKVVDTMSLGATFLGRMMDEDSACGCMVSSHGTPVFQLKFGSAVTFEQLPDLYVVVTAAFADSADQGATGPMTVTEYWIAKHEDRDLILNTPEYEAARKRSRANMPSDCANRRNRVLAQINRLRGASAVQIFQPVPPPK